MEAMELRAAVDAMMQEGISADQFSNFVTTYGIQEDTFVAAIVRELRSAENAKGQASMSEWSTEGAEKLIKLLKSCKENVVSRPSVE